MPASAMRPCLVMDRELVFLLVSVYFTIDFYYLMSREVIVAATLICSSHFKLLVYNLLEIYVKIQNRESNVKGFNVSLFCFTP